MHITQLDIDGFRSLASVSWKPGALNVVIGPNGSGKSNLLLVLKMIAEGAQGGLSDFIQFEGGMNALVWDGQAQKIKFALATSPLNETAFSITGEETLHLPSISYAVAVGYLGNGNSYCIESEALSVADTDSPRISRIRQQAIIDDVNEAAVLKPDAVSEQELVISVANSPYSSGDKIPLFTGYLKAWSIYHAINTSVDAPIRQPVVTRVESQVAPNGQNLINVLHTLYTGNREFKASINSAMRAAFGPDYDELIFAPASTQRIELQISWKTLERPQSAADLSDGTLRFLFLMAVLANPHPAPLIAIDEPETGLHPSMLPIIADYAVEASRRTQVIFTTHSDQFLDAFGETKPTTTVAKWEDGKTTLTVLAEAELAYWLKDYTLGKLFRTGELEALA